MHKGKQFHTNGQDSIAIGLCGEMYSGKDTAADYIVSKYGFRKFSYSTDVLKPIISLSQGKETREVYITLGTSLDKVFGNFCLDSLLHRRIRQSHSKKIVIPNIRIFNNVEYWKNESGFEFCLILVLAEQSVRVRRWLKMSSEKPLHEYDKMLKTQKDFEILNRKDLDETDLSDLLRNRKFDFTIDNNSDLTNLYVQIDAVMKLVEKDISAFTT
jgi:dephospho-CoA kinase